MPERAQWTVMVTVGYIYYVAGFDFSLWKYNNRISASWNNNKKFTGKLKNVEIKTQFQPKLSCLKPKLLLFWVNTFVMVWQIQELVKCNGMKQFSINQPLEMWRISKDSQHLHEAKALFILCYLSHIHSGEVFWDITVFYPMQECLWHQNCLLMPCAIQDLSPWAFC